MAKNRKTVKEINAVDVTETVETPSGAEQEEHSEVKAAPVSETITAMTEAEANAFLTEVHGIGVKRNWLRLDKLITSLSDKANGITKQSVTQGLILRNTGHKVDGYNAKSITAIIAELTEDDKRLVSRGLSAIKASVSLAHNKPAIAKKKKEKAEKEEADDKDAVTIETLLSANMGELEVNIHTVLTGLDNDKLDKLKVRLEYLLDSVNLEIVSRSNNEKIAVNS